jgi:fumarate reductase subunit C
LLYKYISLFHSKNTTFKKFLRAFILRNHWVYLSFYLIYLFKESFCLFENLLFIYLIKDSTWAKKLSSLLLSHSWLKPFSLPTLI